MNRRLFFRAFAGAPVVAAAKVMPAPKDEIAFDTGAPKCAGCGAYLAIRKLVPSACDSQLFVICEFTTACPQHGKALLIPKVALQAERPDAGLLAVALKEEAETSRVWNEEKAARDAAWDRSLVKHSVWIAS